MSKKRISKPGRSNLRIKLFIKKKSNNNLANIQLYFYVFFMKACSHQIENFKKTIANKYITN